MNFLCSLSSRDTYQAALKFVKPRCPDTEEMGANPRIFKFMSQGLLCVHASFIEDEGASPFSKYTVYSNEVSSRKQLPSIDPDCLFVQTIFLFQSMKSESLGNSLGSWRYSNEPYMSSDHKLPIIIKDNDPACPFSVLEFKDIISSIKCHMSAR
jgi:hypothetical protein